MSKESERRKAYSESRSKNRKKNGNNKEDMFNISESYDNHMGTGTGTGTITGNRTETETGNSQAKISENPDINPQSNNPRQANSNGVLFDDTHAGNTNTSTRPKKSAKRLKLLSTEEMVDALDFPFPEQFKEKWLGWLRYRKAEHDFSYRSLMTMQQAVNKLAELSEGNPMKAEQIIKQSIDNAWKGLFKLKKDEYDKQQERLAKIQARAEELWPNL
jgi:hypothetical protein